MMALLFFSMSFIYASCEEGQVDINSASVGELDSISQIGPARAEQIISLRPFSSVDDMIRIVGIGETNINLIKSQGLACVSEEETSPSAVELEENKRNDTNLDEEANVNSSLSSEPFRNSSSKNIELKAIDLNPKAIKSDADSQVSDKRNYAIYGLLGFGVLLGLLFLIKNFIGGDRHKNEFS
jgi:hypothetical protein